MFITTAVDRSRGIFFSLLFSSGLNGVLLRKYWQTVAHLLCEVKVTSKQYKDIFGLSAMLIQLHNEEKRLF